MKKHRSLRAYERKARRNKRILEQNYAEFIKTAKGCSFFTRIAFAWQIIIGVPLRVRIQRMKNA